MKIAIPDLISNSYFPAIAAVELGFFKEEGLDMSLELVYPVSKAYASLRDGELKFVGGAVHAIPKAFPEWQGVKLLGALAQHMYWFLVLRTDLGAKRGDVEAVKGLKIGAAPDVDLGLQRLLVDAGLDLERDQIDIGPVPGAGEAGVSFGVQAAKALEDGKLDGFWANGMGAETAVQKGVGSVVLDVRRGDGPPAARHYTFSALVTTEKTLREEPEVARAGLNALVKAQAALKEDVSRATAIAKNIFPAYETDLISKVVERDLPYYEPAITPSMVDDMLAFEQNMSLISRRPSYDNVVATELSDLW